MTGLELRARRHELGLTQVQLASALGVRSNTVARWERGELPMRPMADKLMALLCGRRRGKR
ncbi:MAG: hypothetical protein A2V88_08790 [Elusimicrobia bacterium RBG_16_66_12]|nr:MAG: hypothetical protein A2V88_08790 [Elusimicrobia bacterium RBG_16_66_12]